MTTTAAKILIVEDESIVAQDLQAILEDLGYHVPVFVDSGELAIAQATEIQPNLILMDIRLIGAMDGIETAQKIREQFDIPIIYLTAHGDESTLARAKITQPFGYIIKPFQEQELQIAIEIALYKHQIDQKIKANAQWLSIILNSIGDGVITTDLQGIITFINPAAEKIIGWSLTEAINQPITSILKLINTNTKQSLDQFLLQAIQSHDFAILPEATSLIRKNGIEVPIAHTISPIAYSQNITPLTNIIGELTGVVIIFQNDSERRLTEQQLRHQAFYDFLTNLPNRIWFAERLNDAIERAKRNPNYLFAVLFLDLDGFKTINDSLGHWVGDQLLISVAARLLKSVRPMDTVARLGGDEFGILLENLSNIHEVSKVAERINEDLSVSFQLKKNQVSINTSIGIVFSSSGYNTIGDVMQDADTAMYRAKERGKGCYEIFDESMRQEASSFLSLESELRLAVKAKQLDVYYQPIISLKTQKIMGFEALVVWQHPQKGLLAADDFIHIAKEMELILEVDNWVLKKACSQLKFWQENYVDAKDWVIRVNVSGRQFLKSQLETDIKNIVQAVGLEFHCLQLEITESVLMQNPEVTMVILSSLKELGIGLSIDDFGTGYSSLSYLHRFPINGIKIDRSLVHQLEQETNSLKFVRSMILLATNLGLDVIAEGVENSEQMALLQQLECEYAQGYLWGKPGTASTIAHSSCCQ